MTDCTCTCLMCHLYGHRPDLVHCDHCPEHDRKKPADKFPMHPAGKR